MEESTKGTLTSLSSLFPADEAHKAAKRVEDTIAKHQENIDCIKVFIADNSNLINLVQKLPDQLQHDIMVPFGKAAFFPGKLIHTNEFLVLLGENYYAERTSKQTIEILKRREKVLESEVQFLKAIVKDLKAEASFFGSTAVESKEGVVEIREDYNENDSTEMVYQTGPFKENLHSSVKVEEPKGTYGDEEYSRLMSKLDELEKEELEDESVNSTGADCSNVTMRLNEPEEEDFAIGSVDECKEEEAINADFDILTSSEESQLQSVLVQSKVKPTMIEKFPIKNDNPKDFADQINLEKLTMQPAPEDDISRGKSLAYIKSMSDSSDETFMASVVKENDPRVSPSLAKAPIGRYNPNTDSLKAFTCSIVEHTDNLPNYPREQTPVPQPLKPVSRFKMQRR